MSNTIIKLENISKQYRLGTVGTQTLRGDFQRWWHRMRGKEDPTLKIGASNKLDAIEGEYVWALKDINLEVKQGEVLGIIGKNGAGKSTLLKLLSRVTGPTTGQIKVKGRIASLLEVGTGFHPELTGRENIFLNGAILGMTKTDIRLKFDEIVDFAGVAKYIDTPVKRYSSGMYVRLAFAVAAHLEPDILVVDEVLAVGDAEFQKKAIGKMQDISIGTGRTVLFVSHNMGSVKALCTKGMVLENGEIALIGDVESTVNIYLERNEPSFKTRELIDKGGSKEMEILEYVTLNTKNEGSKVFFVGESLILVVKAIFKQHLNKVYIGVNFRNSNNEVVTHLHNMDDSHPISGNATEIFNYKIQIPNIYLSPGLYMIDIGIIKDDKPIHILENCIQIEILKGVIIGRPGHFPKNVKVFTPSTWEQKKIEFNETS